MTYALSVRVAAVTLDVTHTLLECPRLGAIYAEVLGRHGLTVEAEAVERTIPIVWQELACSAPVPHDRFTAHRGGARGWWQGFIERLCALLGAPRPSRFAAVELFDRFAEGETYAVFPEVHPTLGALRERGVGLAVVSNWDTRLPRLLERLDLARYFTAIVPSAEVGREKPDRAIFDHALARLGVPAAAAVHVGDHRREDVEGAQGAGMHALWLDRKQGRGDLRHLGELISWIEG